MCINNKIQDKTIQCSVGCFYGQYNTMYGLCLTILQYNTSEFANDNTIQYCTIQYNTIQYNTTQYMKH